MLIRAWVSDENGLKTDLSRTGLIWSFSCHFLQQFVKSKMKSKECWEQEIGPNYEGLNSDPVFAAIFCSFNWHNCNAHAVSTNSSTGTQ